MLEFLKIKLYSDIAVVHRSISRGSKEFYAVHQQNALTAARQGQWARVAHGLYRLAGSIEISRLNQRAGFVQE